MSVFATIVFVIGWCVRNCLCLIVFGLCLLVFVFICNCLYACTRALLFVLVCFCLCSFGCLVFISRIIGLVLVCEYLRVVVVVCVCLYVVVFVCFWCVS